MTGKNRGDEEPRKVKVLTRWTRHRHHGPSNPVEQTETVGEYHGDPQSAGQGSRRAAWHLRRRYDATSDAHDEHGAPEEESGQ